jgi:hypothetical protein
MPNDNDKKYLDKNGNDTRYGKYFSDIWYPDPPAIIKLKKSGEWNKLSHIEQKWMFEENLTFDKELLDRLEKTSEETHKFMEEFYKNRPKVKKINMAQKIADIKNNKKN